MADPRDIRIDDFDYHLPPSAIASFPARPRDHSRLLIWKGDGTIAEDIFSGLACHLPFNSLMVMNETRVVHARLLFVKPGGAAIELFLLNPLEPSKEHQEAFRAASPVVWECLIGNLRRWKDGPLAKTMPFGSGSVTLMAEKVSTTSSGWAVRFSWEPSSASFSEIIEMAGLVPLPPYIRRQAVPEDRIHYQTVYARREGSVAAPTAGLHFTEGVFASLKGKDITQEYISLHVGAGTFRPVVTETVGSHQMHPEPFFISVATLRKIRDNKHSSLIAVGTTTVRSLESIYWFGVKLAREGKALLQRGLFLEQWEPYHTDAKGMAAADALNVLIAFAEDNGMDELRCTTRLMIVPGYRFRLVEGMITNFHQPRSTLLLLVAAYAGKGWKQAYDYALNQGFRFLSYGDSCLFLKI